MQTKNGSLPVGESGVKGVEYIDIVDVIGFLWRAKIWIFSGIFIGLVGAFFVFRTKMRPTYYTSVPFSAVGFSPGLAVAELNRFVDGPEVKPLISAKYSAHSNSDPVVDGNFPLKFVMSGSNYILEVAAKFQDSSGMKALGIASDLSRVVAQYRKDLIDHSSALDSGTVVVKKTDLESTFTKLVAMQSIEESPYRVKLFAMEALLAQKSGTRPIPATSVLGTAMGDDVLRLMGILGSKLSNEERVKMLSEYGMITGAIKAIQAKYDLPIRELSGRFAPMSPEIIASVNAVPFPVPVIDEPAFRVSVAAGTHERKESKLPIILALGVIIGAAAGIFGYGTKTFIEDNQDRIRAAIGA
jgi:hypothetical protein